MEVIATHESNTLEVDQYLSYLELGYRRSLYQLSTDVFTGICGRRSPYLEMAVQAWSLAVASERTRMREQKLTVQSGREESSNLSGAS